MIETQVCGHGSDAITIIMEHGEYAHLIGRPLGYGRWDKDQFGVNVASAKIELDCMIGRWREEANSWWCGEQDHYGEMMDDVAKFCGYDGYWERGR